MEPGNPGAHLSIGHGLVTPAAVSGVAHYRMLQPLQMHPDLVRPSGLDLHVEQGESFITTAHTVKRERGAPSPHDGHARPIARVARNRLLNASRLLFDAAVNERDIGFEDFAQAK